MTAKLAHTVRLPALLLYSLLAFPSIDPLLHLFDVCTGGRGAETPVDAGPATRHAGHRGQRAHDADKVRLPRSRPPGGPQSVARGACLEAPAELPRGRWVDGRLLRDILWCPTSSVQVGHSLRKDLAFASHILGIVSSHHGTPITLFRSPVAYDDDVFLHDGGYLHPNDGLPAATPAAVRPAYLHEQYTQSLPTQGNQAA